VVGNECEAYLPVSPLYNAKRLRAERFQPFSLLNQPRDDSRLMLDILAGEGIGPESRVGCVGWKYFSSSEHPTGRFAVDLPAYLVDTLRELAGEESVENATDLLMHPGYGLRARASASEIAYFEYTGVLASEGVRRMLFGLRPGMSDHELASLSGYCGVPLGCHMTMVTGATKSMPLTSPIGARVVRGNPLATNVCYWGANCCRAGWVVAEADELEPAAQDYVEAFAGPYVEVMADWFSTLRIGTAGGGLEGLVADGLPFDRFGIFLNAGHLIHLDEWLSSPIYPQSEIPLASGMVIQVDVIPDSPTYFSTRMEDGLVLADKNLRQELAAAYPECYGRCQARRRFMIETLGYDLPDEVLPLTNMPAIVPPFFLQPNLLLALET
jgi:hypothetical protein